MSDEGNALFVEVAFNLPVRGAFWYKAETPKEAGAKPLVGRRVSATFGKRKITGFIVREEKERPASLQINPAKIKSVIRIIDDEPFFGKAEIETAEWMAGFYLCSLARRFLQCSLPQRRSAR